ncbi:hypothetical protein CRG98_005657 [Punica granatum]|uniref:Uncharacterized protein n=1 Tax=Punica granatum TaxID=22663 RepID=A0A2I0KZQ9_PUNGR|nr:hypothetical protein CRG98_005657 [Punica granatum]
MNWHLKALKDYFLLARGDFFQAAIKLRLQFSWNIENQESFTNSSELEHITELLRLAGWRMRNIVTALLLHHNPLLLPLAPPNYRWQCRRRLIHLHRPVIKNQMTLSATSDSVSLTALTSLSISEIVELFKSLPSLQTLNISECPLLKALSGRVILRYLPVLGKLEILSCEELDLSTNDYDDDDDYGGGEDMPMTPNLQSTKLLKLVLDYIPKLETFPWWIRHLTNLERLIILSCQNLKTLPERFPNLTSLQSHTIWNCGEKLIRRCYEGRSYIHHSFSLQAVIYMDIFKLPQSLLVRGSNMEQLEPSEQLYVIDHPRARDPELVSLLPGFGSRTHIRPSRIRGLEPLVQPARGSQARIWVRTRVTNPDRGLVTPRLVEPRVGSP